MTGLLEGWPESPALTWQQSAPETNLSDRPSMISWLGRLLRKDLTWTATGTSERRKGGWMRQMVCTTWRTKAHTNEASEIPTTTTAARYAHSPACFLHVPVGSVIG